MCGRKSILIGLITMLLQRTRECGFGLLQFAQGALQASVGGGDVGSRN